MFPTINLLRRATMLSEGGSFCAQFGEREKRLPGNAKASPHLVVVRRENAGLFAKVSPIWRYCSPFSDGNAESMRDALPCGGGFGRVLACARAACANFARGRGRLRETDTKNPPNGDGLFGG